MEYIRIILKQEGLNVDAYLEWKPVKDCLSSHSLEAVILNLVPVNLWEKGSYNVLKGSTVAYGEATNKTGYNYKWENIVTYHNTLIRIMT